MNNGSGGENVVLDDVAEGAKLSVGNVLGRARWSLPARDLDKAFIAAPENFSGSMIVSAKLYSSDNLLLETKSIRFEWTSSLTDNREGDADLLKSANATIPDDTSQNAIGFLNETSHRRPEGPTTESSVFSARTCNLIGHYGADCVSQNSSVLLGPAYSSPNKKPLGPTSTSPHLTDATPLESGERLLRNGNVAAARPLLRRAADAGSADAALDLAISFDPAFVPSANKATADPVKAARWYARALKLGRKDVAADLERVSNLIKLAPPKGP